MSSLVEHGEGHRAEVLDLPLEPQHGDRITVLGELAPAAPDLRPTWIDGWLIRAEPWGLWWVARDGGAAMLTPWPRIVEVDAGWIGGE